MNTPKFIEQSKDYDYRLRSCTNCLNFAQCEDKAQRDYRLTWLDCGKCGCRNYVGEHQSEKPTPSPNALKKTRKNRNNEKQ